MKEFRRKLHLRWSDLDPINHVRHSVYYDFAAQLRTELFLERDITIQDMSRQNFGPILFEEKATFRRELRYGDNLEMTAALQSLRRDFGRFAFLHEIWREDMRCATVEIYGAWINLKERKLTTPPADFIEKLGDLPKAPNFYWTEAPQEEE